MTKRRCANWLMTYRDYILPRTDAPESFIYWSGIFTLACAIRRKVCIPSHYFGLYETTPFLFLMFVGPPGVRKTTTIAYGAEILLNQVDGIKAGPSVFTKEAIIEKLQQSSDASLYLTIGEFSDIFQKAGKDRGSLYEFFNSMYDGKLTYEASTKTQGNAFLERPCVNFFSATTPGWITDNMPEGVLSGGFGSRVIWVAEQEPRMIKSFFHDVKFPYEDNPSISFDDLEKDLLLDLIHIAKEISGEYVFTPEALEFAVWKSVQPHSMALKKNEKLGGYLNRKFTQISKVAQLIALAQRDELIITKDDWELAINSVEATEPGLQTIFSGVGKNKHFTEIDKIVSYVKAMNLYSKKPVPRSDILRNFGHAAEPRMLADLLMFAVDSKQLAYRVLGNDDFEFWIPEFKAQLLLGA